MTNSRYVKEYVDFLRRKTDVRQPLRVVFDCSNGATGIVLKELKIENCKLKIINSKIDGHFPAHGPNPSLPGALNQLSHAVKSFKADIGIAFDADGDRAFFVDEKGREVPPYFIAAFLAQFHKPPYVFDIFNFETLKYAGFRSLNKSFPSRVGTYFIKNELTQRRASFAAEYSGHYYFKDFFGADSGILAAIKALNALSRLSKPFSGITEMLPQKIFVSQFNLKVKAAAVFFEKLNRNYSNQASKIVLLDGITFEFTNGWLTARPSNTEPLIRCFIGGKKSFVHTNQKALCRMRAIS